MGKSIEEANTIFLFSGPPLCYNAYIAADSAYMSCLFPYFQESEDAVKVLAKEKDLLEREKWELRRQAKEATDHASSLRSQLDLKDNRIKELEAELSMVRYKIYLLSTVVSTI